MHEQTEKGVVNPKPLLDRLVGQHRFDSQPICLRCTQFVAVNMIPQRLCSQPPVQRQLSDNRKPVPLVGPESARGHREVQTGYAPARAGRDP